MNVDAIPAELRERPQWVLWRLEERDGKATKVPYRADGAGRASTTEPATWSSFEDALAASDVADGVGYVFSAEDPYVGVDLDAGLSAGDRGAIMLALDSYAETSVSGEGVHVIVRASLNGGRNRRGPFEVYEQGRYFVVTGEHIRGTPTTVEQRQAELEEVLAEFMPPPPTPDAVASSSPIDLDDQELLERARAAKNGAKFERLWNGDVSGYGSASEADLALCGHLAFWTGRDAARIDALFRTSGLMRPKWDERRGDTTYGALTIETAIAATHDVYTPPRATSQANGEDIFRLEPVDWQAIAAGGVPRLEYLAEPFLPRRKRIWAVGPGESGKSIWAAVKSSELSRAQELVVYVSQENGLEEEARRFLRLRPDFAHLRLYVDQGLDLALPSHRAELLAVSDGAALVVLDTFTACWSGDEDSNDDLAAFDRDVMKPLMVAGSSVLVLDHTGNPQPNVRRRGVSAPRGASSKGQKTDFLIEFRATGDGTFQVERGKKRGTSGKEPRSYQVVDAPEGTLELIETEAADDARDLAGEIAELLEDGEWWTANKIRQPKGQGGVGADRAAVKSALEDGRFESTDGPAIGERKGSTYYRLRACVVDADNASQRTGARVEEACVVGVGPYRGTTHGNACATPLFSADDASPATEEKPHSFAEAEAALGELRRRTGELVHPIEDVVAEVRRMRREEERP